MKDKNLRVTIQQHRLPFSEDIGIGLHWYVSFSDSSERTRQFARRDLKEARRFALSKAYAKNITVYE